MDNIADLHHLHCFESDAEHLEFIDALVPDTKYRVPVAECVEGGVCSPNPMQRALKAAKEWPSSAIHPGGSKPAQYLLQI
jgi:hypothetical protein